MLGVLKADTTQPGLIMSKYFGSGRAIQCRGVVEVLVKRPSAAVKLAVVWPLAIRDLSI